MLFLTKCSSSGPAALPLHSSASIPSMCPSLTVNLPRLGLSLPASTLSAVDLPMPLVPTRPRTWPGRGMGNLWVEKKRGGGARSCNARPDTSLPCASCQSSTSGRSTPLRPAEKAVDALAPPHMPLRTAVKSFSPHALVYNVNHVT